MAADDLELSAEPNNGEIPIPQGTIKETVDDIDAEKQLAYPATANKFDLIDILNTIPWADIERIPEQLQAWSIPTDKGTVKLIDLTCAHATLEKFIQDVVQNGLEEEALRYAFLTAVKLNLNFSVDRIRECDIPLFLQKNHTSNNLLLRIYTARLGKDANCTELFGLMAAVRTKGNQRRALGILNGAGSVRASDL